jgi:hypothetical protein
MRCFKVGRGNLVLLTKGDSALFVDAGADSKDWGQHKIGELNRLGTTAKNVQAIKPYIKGKSAIGLVCTHIHDDHTNVVNTIKQVILEQKLMAHFEDILFDSFKNMLKLSKKRKCPAASYVAAHIVRKVLTGVESLALTISSEISRYMLRDVSKHVNQYVEGHGGMSRSKGQQDEFVDNLNAVMAKSLVAARLSDISMQTWEALWDTKKSEEFGGAGFKQRLEKIVPDLKKKRAYWLAKDIIAKYSKWRNQFPEDQDCENFRNDAAYARIMEEIGREFNQENGLGINDVTVKQLIEICIAKYEEGKQGSIDGIMNECCKLLAERNAETERRIGGLVQFVTDELDKIPVLEGWMRNIDETRNFFSTERLPKIEIIPIRPINYPLYGGSKAHRCNLMLKVIYENNCIFLPGDADASLITQLTYISEDNFRLDLFDGVTCMLLSHHGSSDNSEHELFNIIARRGANRPLICIASSDPKGKDRLPADWILESDFSARGQFAVCGEHNVSTRSCSDGILTTLPVFGTANLRGHFLTVCLPSDSASSMFDGESTTVNFLAKWANLSIIPVQQGGAEFNLPE